jgi:hypothetical protein
MLRRIKQFAQGLRSVLGLPNPPRILVYAALMLWMFAGFLLIGNPWQLALLAGLINVVVCHLFL